MNSIIFCLAFVIVGCATSTTFNTEVSQIAGFLGLSQNGFQGNSAGRSMESLEDTVEDFVKAHDAKFELPLLGSTVTLSTSNLEQGELDLNLKFSSASEVQARKKSKLKKIMMPILIFILLKAITLVPLALGILGIKAWNSLQLSFFSFIISVSLAVFQLCTKLSSDHGPVVAHDGWVPHHQRALDASVHDIAYSAYRQ